MPILPNIGQESLGGTMEIKLNVATLRRKPHVISCSYSSSSAEVQPNACYVCTEAHHPNFVAQKLLRLYMGTFHPTCAALTADAPRAVFELLLVDQGTSSGRVSKMNKILFFRVGYIGLYH